MSERLPFRFPEPGEDPLAGLCKHCLEAPSGTFVRVDPKLVEVDPVTTVVKLAPSAETDYCVICNGRLKRSEHGDPAVDHAFRSGIIRAGAR